jgi:dihydroceramidase
LTLSLLSNTPGFWGPATATVDWCEGNYVRSYYVCEFFNTISSLAMVVAGALGIGLHRRVLERRFLLAFLAVIVVGLGSIAFHATLRFELQMTDELPMLYSALVMVYILVENQPTPRWGPWFPALLVVHGAFVTCLSALTRGKLQFYLFHSSFGSLEMFGLYGVFAIRRRSRLVAVHRLFRLGMGSYLIAVALWFIDLEFCPTLSVTLPAHGLPNPQFHAGWHVLVSTGLYLMIVLIAYDRLARLGELPQLRYALGIVPHVLPSHAPTHDGVAARTHDTADGPAR